jgi:predicted metal-dependent phosphoesterase TrpH
MNHVLRFAFGVTLYCCLIPQFSTLYAQGPAPSATPPPPSGSQAPRFTEQQKQEMAAKLRERVGKAADEVMGRIRKEEGDLYNRFSYLRKPDRLNPNTYTSKNDVEQWRQLLQQFNEKADTVDKLYANADLDLGNALIQQRINQGIAEQIKKALLSSFPWDIIKRKNQLIKEFVSDFGNLLTFYANNWASWKKDSAGGAPAFDDPKLAASYQSLKEKINAVGTQIEDQYQAMTR